MVQKAVVEIEPLAPFDLALSSLVFAAGDRRVRSFQSGCFSQVVDIGGRLVWVKLGSVGCVSRPRLLLELFSEGVLLEEEVWAVQEVVNRIFSFSVPLGSFYEHVCGDGVMSQVVRRLCGFKFPVTPSVFEAFVDAIVEQQISIKVARCVEDRLAVMFGESVMVGGELFFAFPSAGALVEAGVEGIRRVGLSLRKAEYIYGVAELVVDGGLDLEGLRGEVVDRVVSVLDEVRGVGVWSAELTVLRGMGRFDVLPADDFGIRRAVSRYYCGGGRLLSALEVRKIAEGWGCWRGLAGFYLIAAEALSVEL